MSLDKSIPNLHLELLPGSFQLVRLSPSHPLPASLFTTALCPGAFISVTRNKFETSIIVETDLGGTALEKLVGLTDEVASSGGDRREGFEVEGPWSCLRVKGPMVLTLTGILAALTAPLREAKVPIFAISTYDTDWLLIRSHLNEKAVAALKADGWFFDE